MRVLKAHSNPNAVVRFVLAKCILPYVAAHNDGKQKQN